MGQKKTLRLLRVFCHAVASPFQAEELSMLSSSSDFCASSALAAGELGYAVRSCMAMSMNNEIQTQSSFSYSIRSTSISLSQGMHASSALFMRVRQSLSHLHINAVFLAKNPGSDFFPFFTVQTEKDGFGQSSSLASALAMRRSSRRRCLSLRFQLRLALCASSVFAI